MEKNILEKDFNIQFVQIGANVGDTNNDPLFNKVRAESLSGILVEPNPKAFKELVKNYSFSENLFFENIAISDQNGIIDLYVDNYNSVNGDKGIGTSQHASCLFDVITNKLHHPKDTLSRVPCIAITLEALLDKYNLLGKNIDFLYIDTEGLDAKIILSTDFFICKFHTIQYEYHHLSEQDKNSSLQHLYEYGYKLISINNEDIIVSL